jgi:hypothetical protein
MNPAMLLITRLMLATPVPKVSRQRDDRGDVPGWVLVTVMTAGLVGALWKLAGPQLNSMLTAALDSVRG